MAALDLLDEVGVASPSIGLSIASAAAAAGVNRSTVYRHWPTAADLNTDLAVASACHLPGWQRRILEVEPGTAIEDAIHAALGDRPVEIGSAIRALAAGWGSDVEARRAIAAWESAWLDRFATWASVHVARNGRTWAAGSSPTVLAVGLAATVEGWLVARTLEGAHDDAGPLATVEPLGRRARLLLDELTAPGEPTPDATDHETFVVEAPPGPTGSDARASIARRIIDACIDPATGRWSAEPSRLVDLERLARRLDVSPRWLYQLWPTPAAMNTAIVEAWFERDRSAIDRYANAWLAEAGPAGRATPSERFSRALDDSIRRRVGTVEANQFSLSPAAADPEVRPTLDRIQGEYRALVRLVYLASLSIAGWKQRPGIGVDEYTAIMFEANLGLDRLVALHPDLLEREVEIDGRPPPLLRWPPPPRRPVGHPAGRHLRPMS
ncbi:MAG: hypothetical protein KF703_08210 [Actinobacteria bacterium]|nr:hypothetical protein [Actinomycetota bacterium]